MKNKNLKYYAIIVAFLGVSIVFSSQSQVTLAEFLIFLFCGILIGVNISKLKNKVK
jgi:hypothetical protein